MKPDASAPLLPTAHAASEEKPPVQKRAKRRNALNLSRYLASCWIVAYHYYSIFGDPYVYSTAVTADYWPSKHAWEAARDWFSWGSTWTAYFFFLSGFVLTVSRLDSSAPDELKPTPRFIADRLVTTYPVYLLGLLFEVAYDARINFEPTAYTAYSLVSWRTFAKHLLLVQAWWPNEVVENWTQQEPAWFMSALLSYWAVFGAFYRARAGCRPPRPGHAAALWACSWVRVGRLRAPRL